MPQTIQIIDIPLKKCVLYQSVKVLKHQFYQMADAGNIEALELNLFAQVIQNLFIFKTK